MKTKSKFKSLLLAGMVLLGANTAKAVPVAAVDYSGLQTPGVKLEITSSGVFQTVGANALPSFLNWASFLPALDEGGSIRISGVQLTGAAQSVFGTIAQQTVGGIVEALDSANNVLLSATFTSGVISFAQSGTGSQFSVGLATFGGLFASYFVPDSATHTISLIEWNPVAINQATGNIGASSGLGNGLIAGSQAVPEPATMILLGGGVLGAVIRRRKAE